MCECPCPRDPYLELALLYVKNQDLTGKSPLDIKAMFDAAYRELTEEKCEYV